MVRRIRLAAKQKHASRHNRRRRVGAAAEDENHDRHDNTDQSKRQNGRKQQMVGSESLVANSNQNV